jgi:hypothetical protein
LAGALQPAASTTIMIAIIIFLRVIQKSFVTFHAKQLDYDENKKASHEEGFKEILLPEKLFF